MIRDSELASLHELDELLPLFKRPVDGAVEDYLGPVTAVWEGFSARLSTVKMADAEALLPALYDQGEKTSYYPRVRCSCVRNPRSFGLVTTVARTPRSFSVLHRLSFCPHICWTTV